MSFILCQYPILSFVCAPLPLQDYEALELPMGASRADVKKAYRKLAMQVGGGDEVGRHHSLKMLYATAVAEDWRGDEQLGEWGVAIKKEGGRLRVLLVHQLAAGLVCASLGLSVHIWAWVQVSSLLLPLPPHSGILTSTPTTRRRPRPSSRSSTRPMTHSWPPMRMSASRRWRCKGRAIVGGVVGSDSGEACGMWGGWERGGE